jgi:hypothetical protein
MKQYQPHFEKDTMSDVYSHVLHSGFANDKRPAYTHFHIGKKAPKDKRRNEAAAPVTRMLSVAEQHGYQQNKKHPSIWEHPDGRRIRESNGEWVHESPKIVKEGAHEQRAIKKQG